MRAFICFFLINLLFSAEGSGVISPLFLDLPMIIFLGISTGICVAQDFAEIARK